ncbi:MAG: DUF3604 domain-containing protein [Chloroflexi bacterium]|nr:DUF3604 domain-containing protein [Chloroflexota bacterium]
MPKINEELRKRHKTVSGQLNQYGPHEAWFTLIEWPGEGVFVLAEATDSGHDFLRLRALEGNRKGDSIEFATQYRANCWPAFHVSDQRLVVIHTCWENHCWQLVEHAIKDGKLGASKRIPTGSHHAFRPSLAVEEGSGVMHLVHTQYDEIRQSVVHQSAHGGAWSTPLRISAELPYCSRPEVVSCDTELFAVWDSYQEGAYDVVASGFVSGQWSQPFRISSAPGWDLKPSAYSLGGGRFLVLWVKRFDVRCDGGVIDQHHYLCAALVEEGQVQLLGGEHGAVADLAHGMLAWLQPEREAIWGYMGRRRHPLAKPDGNGGAWLLWERKEQRDGGTGHVFGQLCGRNLSFDGQLGAPLALAQGALFYDVDPTIPMTSDVLLVGCLEGHIGAERKYSVRRLDLSKPQEALDLSEPEGWQRVKLPRDIRTDRLDQELYWGDLHVHSMLSTGDDAQGEPDEIYHYARDIARLDFMMMTDNDSYMLDMRESEWRQGLFFAEQFNKPGRFVTLLGFEWTCADDTCGVNHRSVVLPGAEPDIPRWPGTSRKVEYLVKLAEEKGWLLHAHHQKWRLADSPVEVNVEAASGWDIYIEHGDIFRALNEGGRFGLVGGSDCHRRNPGLCGALTGVRLKTLSREALIDALSERMQFATSGSRIVVNLSIEETPNGADTASGREMPVLSVSVKSSVPMRTLEIIRDGEVVVSKSVEGKSCELTWTDAPLSPGQHWYLVRVKANFDVTPYPANLVCAQGNLAWSRPLWYELL